MTAARADDVLFTGTVTSLCSILAHTDGHLALNTNGDALTSEVTSGGSAGTITILSVGSNHITTVAPIRTAQGSGYVATGETIEVSLLGATGLSFVNQAFTTNPAVITVPASIAASVLTVGNRINNANGFAAGNYATKTTITCAP